MRGNKKGGVKIFVIILVLLIAVAGVCLAMKIFGGDKEEVETANSDNIVENTEDVQVII